MTVILLTCRQQQHNNNNNNSNNNNNNCFTALCLGLPGWASNRRNVHPLIPILINDPLSASSVYCDPYHPPCSIYMLGSLFAPPLCLPVPRLCLLFLSLFLNSLLGILSFTLTSHIYDYLIILISACWIVTSFSFLTFQVSIPCNILLRTQLLYSLPLIIIYPYW